MNDGRSARRLGARGEEAKPGIEPALFHSARAGLPGVGREPRFAMLVKGRVRKDVIVGLLPQAEAFQLGPGLVYIRAHSVKLLPKAVGVRICNGKRGETRVGLNSRKIDLRHSRQQA